MNHAIVLAGGIGSRMNMNIPKQYYKVGGQPIIMYSIKRFALNPLISSIVVVIADEWRSYLTDIIDKESFSSKVIMAEAGKSRQHSVYNGLRALKEYAAEDDKVLVHDAVRPLFPDSNIEDGITACDTFDAALPVISVKDATYQSHDGIVLSNILPRDELYSGQSPECFVFGKYWEAHSRFSDEEIASIRGGSELALRAGLSVKLIKGTERNFKITTVDDLRAFELIVG